MEKVSWPAYFYGPQGQAQVFQSEAEVPKGWEDHPSKHGETAAKAPAAPAAPKAPAVPKEGAGEGAKEGAGEGEGEELDAANWPWSANLHAASKSKTNAGLWRMKVGVSRPDAKPAPVKLDL